MMTKITTPIVREQVRGMKEVTGVRVEYRLFGILLYRKTLVMPEVFGIYNYDNYQITF